MRIGIVSRGVFWYNKAGRFGLMTERGRKMPKRKRVALFGNGWSYDYFQEVGYGICRRGEEADTDIFAFVNFSAHLTQEEEKRGEFNIFLLPDLADFDGVLLLSNTFNLEREKEYLFRKIRELSIPAISMEYEADGIDYFGTDNYSGMYDLIIHMIEEHGAQRIVFIGGIPGHADSDTRLRATMDAAKEKGVTIREEDILYGSWAAAEACERFSDWLKEHGKLPDAIICANDIMAVGICDWLTEHGYLVPRDVKVTGYDCINSAQMHSPSITSICQEWAELGYCVMGKLLDKIEGKEVSSWEKMKSRVVFGESCGCQRNAHIGGKPGNLSRAVMVKKFDGVATDQHFRHMYTSVRKVETIGELHNSLSAFFAHENAMEGDNMMLCLRTDFFVVEDDEESYKTPGYGEEMDVICSVTDCVAEEYRRMPTKEAVFLNSERRDRPGTYIFLPVRSDDKNLGFVMLGRDFNIVADLLLYIWTRHLNQYMEQVRQNVKLAELTRKLRELSVTDVLTGLYNRMGCEKNLYPFAKACQERGGRVFVLLADVDRMKLINDRYGHGSGDIALQTVAFVLKTELPGGFMAARFGGDEFFIVGETEKKITIEEISERLTGCLAREVKRRRLEFPLSISVGGIRLARGEQFQLMECLQRVDEYMYRVKEEHHRSMDAGN